MTTFLFGNPVGVHVYGTGGFATGRALEIEWESPLWWQRKPKRITDEEATEAIAKAAAVIRAKATEQVAEAIPEAQRKGQARRAIEPAIAQMPGFDWRPMYDRAYSEALTQAILTQLSLGDARRRAAVRRQQQDNEIALLLLI